MLKGFAITPVVNGRIAIGETVHRNGKNLPSKLDEMRITSNVQKDGTWIIHPVQAAQKEGEKLRKIPVRILFDRPDNNFRAELSAFDNKGRPICTGNGETAKRRQKDGSIADVACVGCDSCSFGHENRCKQFARLLIGIEGEWQKDPLSGFMFRTTSFNSIRALSSRLNYFYAFSGGKIAGMPCWLTMKARSTAASMRRPIFYLDLEPRAASLSEAFAESRNLHAEWAEQGLCREALEVAVANGYSESAFFESDEDGAEVVEEFFNTEAIDQETGEIINIETGKPISGKMTRKGSKKVSDMPTTPGATSESEAPASDSAPASNEPEPAAASNEDLIARVETFIAEQKRSLSGMMEWLSHPADTPLKSLSTEELQRVHDVLAARSKKVSAAA